MSSPSTFLIISSNDVTLAYGRQHGSEMNIHLSCFTFINVNATVSPRTSAAETREREKHEFKVLQQRAQSDYMFLIDYIYDSL